MITYLTSLDLSMSQSLFHEFLKLVCDAKRQQILRYHRREDSLRCLFGELLLLYGLRNRYGIMEYELITNQYGKPYLKEYCNIYFNKTHAGRSIGCAIGETEMGLDIERILPLEYLEDMEELSVIYMTEAERAAIASLQPPEKMQMFFWYWTRKEALAKCAGCGMGMMRNGTIIRSGTSISTITRLLTPDYFISLSSYQEKPELQLIDISMNEFMTML